MLFVGVRCELADIVERRRASDPETYPAGGDEVPEPVLCWQREVHRHWTYDLEVDTSAQTPEECADAIRRRLDERPGTGAFARLTAADPAVPRG